MSSALTFDIFVDVVIDFFDRKVTLSVRDTPFSTLVTLWSELKWDSLLSYQKGKYPI